MSEARDVAYYTDGIAWSDSDWAKSNLLFFDELAMLVPAEEDDAFYSSHPEVIQGMVDAKCLRIMRPLELVDVGVASRVLEEVNRVVTEQQWRGSGRHAQHLMHLDKLGFRALTPQFIPLFESLCRNGLAENRLLNGSVPVDQRVFVLILSVLAGACRTRGADLGLSLSPVSDNLKWARAISDELVGQDTIARVIESDVEHLKIDVGSVPIDEIVSFRTSNKKELDAYRLSVARHAIASAGLCPADQERLGVARTTELEDAKSDLERVARPFMLASAKFLFRIGGIGWTAYTGDPTGAIIVGGEVVLDAVSGDRMPRNVELAYIVGAASSFRGS